MRKISLLILDDDADIAESLRETLAEANYDVAAATSIATARRYVGERFFDLLVLDEQIDGSNISGTDFLIECRRRHPGIGAIFVTGNATVKGAVRAMHAGALDLLQKPVTKGELLAAIVRALGESLIARETRYLRTDAQRTGGIVAVSKAMKGVLEQVARVGPANVTVLLQGESGTGKERLAHAIHVGSQRCQGPFLAVNCAAIPESLVESVLFGHAKGAFTGAAQFHAGYFEAAHRGTLFLDEIGEMPSAAQSRLLRVLQERKIVRVGETKEIPVDVRVVAATNRNLPAEVKAGRFREDLFYRIGVAQIEVPPLRSRREDIPALAFELVEEHSREMGRPIHSISPEAIQQLVAHDWPGNVRQLSNVIEMAVLYSDTAVITPSVLHLGPGSGNDTGLQGLLAMPWKKAREEFGARYFAEHLATTGGDVTKAARQARVHRSVVYQHMPQPKDGKSKKPPKTESDSGTADREL